MTYIPKTNVGEGTLLQISISSSFVTVAQRTTIGGPKATVASIPTTNLDSTSKTYRPSRQPDSGELDLHVFVDPNDTNSHQTLMSRVVPQGSITTAPPVDSWKLIFNDGNTTPANATFSGFLTAFELDGMEEEQNLGANITIKLTGPIAWNPGTP